MSRFSGFVGKIKIAGRCRMATQKKIIDGPSKFDLMLSLFDGDIQHRRIAKFTLAGDAEIRVFVDSIEREDGSGESWNITGNIHGRVISTALMKAYGEKFEMYFSTKKRKGTITL